MNARIQNKPSQIRLAPGTVLRGTYKVEGVYGEGGFAVVYKALQINLRRHVAIKVLNPVPDNHDGEAMIQRFLQEATAAANIRHANVVMIHDVGFLDDRRPYIVMEPFEGHDLRQHLRKHGPLTPTRWLPLVHDCLGALSKAHREGIIHRDIKPSNLVLTDPGSPDESLKLIDFGIARLLNDQVNLTMDFQRVGTMRYMAPEYITSNVVSPAMDVFQMGLILVEGLTGLPVIQGRNDGQCIHMITSGALVVPSSLWASPLGPVIKGALELDPAKRFIHAGEMREALSKVDPAQLVGLELSASAAAQNADDATVINSVDILYPPDTNTHTPVVLKAMPTVLSSTQRSSVGRGHSVKDAPQRGAVRAKRWPWLVVIAIWSVGLFMLGLIVVLMWGTWRYEAPHSAVEQTTLSVVESNGSASDEDAPVEERAERGAAVAPVIKPAPESSDSEVRSPAQSQPVVIEARPSHAAIYIDDELVGHGEVQTSMPVGGRAAMMLRVEAVGYETHEVELKSPLAPSVKVDLKPLVKAAPRAVTRKPGSVSPAVVKKKPAPATRGVGSSPPAVKKAPGSRSPPKPEKPPVKAAPKPTVDPSFDIID